MKKIIVALLLLSSNAYAERWLEMPNNAGGKIILTETKCISSDGKFAIATTPSGANVDGCWYYFADMIHIVWNTGKTTSFNPTDFTARQK